MPSSNSSHVAILNTQASERYFKGFAEDDPVRSLNVLIKPGHPAFLLTYPYGRPIVDQGVFRTPCAECKGCTELSRELVQESRTIPLSLVTKGSVEIFNAFSTNQGIVTRPLRLLQAGELFGVFETLDYLFDPSVPHSTWNLTSGARSVGLLLSNRAALKRAVKEGLKRIGSAAVHPELVIQDDWELLTLASQSSALEGTEPLNAEVLVFNPKSTERRRLHSVGLSAFPALIEFGWLQSKADRLAVRDYNRIVRHARRMVGPMESRVGSFRVIQHILAVARGDVPSFIPAHSESQHIVPVDAFERFCRTAFGSSGPTGIILHPHHLREPGAHGYVSLKAHSEGTEDHKSWYDYSLQVRDFVKTLEKKAFSAEVLGNGLKDSDVRVVSELLRADSTLSDLRQRKIPLKQEFLTGLIKLMRAPRA